MCVSTTEIPKFRTRDGDCGVFPKPRYLLLPFNIIQYVLAAAQCPWLFSGIKSSLICNFPGYYLPAKFCWVPLRRYILLYKKLKTQLQIPSQSFIHHSSFKTVPRGFTR